MVEKEPKNITEYLKKVSPGTALRTVIDDLIISDMGALIVFDSPHLSSAIEGGFKVNTKFTSSKLFELCKMDGAVIISPDVKKILYANVLLTPDTSIETAETGTRHKAGERTAKQAETFVIAVSERKNKATLYLSNTKYFLRNTNDLLGEVNNNLQLLEKQRELFDELLVNFNILEISDSVSVGDVCRVVQRTQTIVRISEMIKRYFTELGNVGIIMRLRYKELIRNIEKIEDNVLRDYSSLTLKKSKELVSAFNFDSLMDLEIIARLMIGKSLDDYISARGYRFLSTLKLSDKEVSELVKQFKHLKKVFTAEEKMLHNILKNHESEIIKNEIDYLKEQIMSGKMVG